MHTQLYKPSPWCSKQRARSRGKGPPLENQLIPHYYYSRAIFLNHCDSQANTETFLFHNKNEKGILHNPELYMLYKDSNFYEVITFLLIHKELQNYVLSLRTLFILSI